MMAADTSLVQSRTIDSEFIDDPILEAVRKYNIQYKNTAYSKQSPIKIGRGIFYIVTFKGEDGETHANFVYKQGNAEPIIYRYLRDLVKDYGNGTLPIGDVDWLRASALFILCILLLAAAFVAGIMDGRHEVFTAFMSAFTATVGFLAGKAVAESKGK